MNAQSAALHRHTPRLNVIDPRGLAIRAIEFCRTQPSDIPELRMNRVAHDDAGRAVRCWDARLWETQAAVNLATVFSLGGQALLSDSVDAGWRLTLAAEGGEVLASWDGNGNERKVQYDSLRRPVAIVENDRCVERLQYGGPDAAGHNQCGRCVRHDDTAGTRMDTAFALTGGVLEQRQHLLVDIEDVDWPELQADRDALIEPGSGAITRWAHSVLGDVITQTDAQGNIQGFVHDVAGYLETLSLCLIGQSDQVLVHSIDYDAQGHVTSETAGNGVVTKVLHDAADGRLIELKGARAEGQLLQHLLYDYDPVGNVLRIEDAAQPTRFFANQRLEPVSTYQYDTLYQLIQATGTEAATVNHGPAFQSFQSSVDPAQLANYTQTYRYDASGNLQQLTHVGAQSHSRTLITSQTSNRSLPVINDQPPDEAAIGAAFDANGNLRELQAGQAMSWDRRNQLQQVRPVVRQSGEDDSERYVYDASGQRVRKVRLTQAKAVVHSAEVRYLPGLEVRTNSATGETLHVIVSQAGRSEVRVLHWQAGKPEELENDQARYSFNDHLGSATLELDKDAQLISQESYYPYGGTSWWAGRSVIEASYKTVRYSGKERDATGLYYYGLRYYAPWLQRWINPDPAGAVDGLNRYQMVRNNPSTFVDFLGLMPLSGFAREVEDARLRAIRAMEKTQVLLEVETVESVNPVMMSFFGRSDSQLKSRWKADLEKVLLVARNTSMRNVEVVDAHQSSGENFVAAVDMAQFLEFKPYLSGAGRIMSQGLSKAESKRELSENRKNYEDVLKTKFLKVDPGRWDQTLKSAGKSHIAQILIHEFSHAALDTKDYVYGKAKAGIDPSPLFKLARGEDVAEFAGSDYRKPVGSAGLEMAYKNADSFAAAVMFTKRSNSKNASQKALYHKFFQARI